MASVSSNVCPICCNVFNTTLRKQITCTLCKADACHACFSHYLMERSTQEAECMFCNEHISLEFINLHANVGFRKKYKQKMVDELAVSEEAKIPATIEMVKEEYQVYRTVMYRYHIHGPEPRDEILDDLYERYASDTAPPPPTASSTNTFPCPKDDCHGAVSDGTCTECKVDVCEKCKEIKEGEAHVCDKDTLATVNLIVTSTKPCPKCATKIFKIDGCDQMFCTKCHTAFSWQTGKIQTKHIHNPHYFEWQRNGGAAANMPPPPEDGLCLPQAFSRLEPHNLAERDIWYQLIEESRTIVQTLGEQLTERKINRDRLQMRKDFVQTSTKYLIDAKKRWRLKLQKHISLMNLTRDLMMILDIFPDVFTEMVRGCKTMAEVTYKFNTDVRDYINTLFRDCCKRHGSKANISLGNHFERFKIPHMFKVRL